MDSYNIFFEKLSKQFDRAIKRECMVFRGKTSEAELYATALIVLWYADITYKGDILNFELYVTSCIHEALKIYLLKSRLKGCLFSLNKQIGRYGSTVEAITTIQAPAADWDMQLIVSSFVSRLKGMEKKVAFALLGKSDTTDIMADYQLSREELKHILSHLREEWIIQYGMP